MDDDDQRVIDFALSWQPFGGPPGEETLTRFGLPAERFRTRVHRILATRGTVVDEPYRRRARLVLRPYLAGLPPIPPTSGDPRFTGFRG
ncbi:hypothetical protein ACIA5E_26495 [Nocardia asteroides]|uniref:hypothetical protein n=1 Tax=Nocardia asteroides TaxID=1824 RepID=UPI0037AEF590